MNTVMFRKHIALLVGILDEYDRAEREGSEEVMAWAEGYFRNCCLFLWQDAKEECDGRGVHQP